MPNILERFRFWCDPDVAGISGRAGKSALHSPGRYSLPFPCWAAGETHKVTRKSCSQKRLAGKFPGFPAAFPAFEAQSADSGQNLQNSELQLKKFAAKFPAAGNCTHRGRAQKGTFSVCGRGRVRLIKLALRLLRGFQYSRIEFAISQPNLQFISDRYL